MDHTLDSEAHREGLRKQYRMAIDPETNAMELDELAKSHSTFIRIAVARHPNVSERTITQLLADDEADVVTVALSRPMAPLTKVIEAFASQSPKIRAAAVSNPKMPQEQLDQALRDHNRDVVCQALQNANINMENLTERIPDMSLDELKALAGNLGLTVDLQVRLAGSKDWRVRGVLAGNPALDPQIAHVFVEDTYSFVRQKLAANPQCPQIERQVLANDIDDTVAYSAREHSNVVLERIIAGYHYRQV